MLTLYKVSGIILSKSTKGGATLDIHRQGRTNALLPDTAAVRVYLSCVLHRLSGGAAEFYLIAVCVRE
ncbi:hypothetical protein SDC9_115422 [bioreactor metagenome]|uniref:Uncharacterized protein n=1 Tax=bioreactor metagenome TaxID=1076179 RepID=A0A645BSU0_9ZZZZ